MAAAAESTGGQYLHNNMDIAASLAAVAAIPEVSYVLGFSPPGDPDGQYHALKTRIRGNRGYRVETRTGYFSAAVPHDTAQQRIDRIAMSAATMQDFPVAVEVQQETENEGEAALRVTLAVTASSLKFPEKEGRRVEELTFLTVLEDAGGNFIAGKQSVMDMALTPAGLAAALQKGVRAAMTFPLPKPGSYRVRPVSYTHLDVYKRQFESRGVQRPGCRGCAG